jgi:thioredoxin 1
MGKTIELNDANFDQIVNSEKPVLVDFWAEWCGPCKMIGPVVEELAGDYEGKAVVGKLNVDENPGVTARYGIRSIPTLLVFKAGQIVDKLAQYLNRSSPKSLRRKLRNNLRASLHRFYH